MPPTPPFVLGLGLFNIVVVSYVSRLPRYYLGWSSQMKHWLLIGMDYLGEDMVAPSVSAAATTTTATATTTSVATLVLFTGSSCWEDVDWLIVVLIGGSVVVIWGV